MVNKSYVNNNGYRICYGKNETIVYNYNGKTIIPLITFCRVTYETLYNTYFSNEKHKFLNRLKNKYKKYNGL